MHSLNRASNHGDGISIELEGRSIAGGTRKLLIAAMGAVMAFGAGSAIATESIVCTNTQEDIEFDHDDGLVQWVDAAHRLWVAQVNATNGNFIPTSAEGTLVDSNVDYAGTWGNGPEFVKSTAGYSLVYNKFKGQSTCANLYNPASTYLARADLVNGAWTTKNDVNSVWSGGTMMGWVEPEGNLNPTQSDPPVVFYDGYEHDSGCKSTNSTNPPPPDTSPLYIMGIHDFVPMPVPGTEGNVTQGSARFVPGLNELVYTQNVTANGATVRQAFSYDVSTGVATQLTFDSSNKGDVFMFQAPELNNAYVLMVSVNRQYINFYTYQYNKTTKASAWTVLYSSYPPQGSGAAEYLFSPEAFFYKNKTYVYMVRSPKSNSTTLAQATDIWVQSMDGTFWNRASNSLTTSPMVRSDPKYYITSTGIFIYWLEYTVASTGVTSQAHGTWKGNSGIPL